MQTSASSMTPLLRPPVTGKSFQEPSWTHPVPFPFAACPQAAAETLQEQCLQEEMQQTQQQRICPSSPSRNQIS